MRRILLSLPVVTAILWLAAGVWAYALTKEPGSFLYGKRWLPISASKSQACR